MTIVHVRFASIVRDQMLIAVSSQECPELGNILRAANQSWKIVDVNRPFDVLDPNRWLLIVTPVRATRLPREGEDLQLAPSDE